MNKFKLNYNTACQHLNTGALSPEMFMQFLKLLQEHQFITKKVYDDHLSQISSTISTISKQLTTNLKYPHKPKDTVKEFRESNQFDYKTLIFTGQLPYKPKNVFRALDDITIS